LALTWLTLGNLLALLAAAITLRIPAPPRWIAAFAGAALLLATILAARPGWPAPIGFLLGPPAAAIVLTRLRPPTATPGPSAQSSPSSTSDKSQFRHRAAFALWLGLVLFLSLLILYYYSMITPLLPIPRALLAPLVAAGAAICALFAATAETAPTLPRRPALAAALLLLLAPALVALGARYSPSVPPPEPGYPVRIMTYNIRAAYGLDGRHDVDAVARVVAGSGADVLAVQELSRGWFAHGSSDLLALLADRLAMPYTVLGPAMDPVAGNAILSRYPILESGHESLPLAGSLVPRGYVWAASTSAAVRPCSSSTPTLTPTTTPSAPASSPPC
jgi:hypothetical protein